MNFVLQRYSDNGTSTLGWLFKKDAANDCIIFQAYTLEDESRDTKVVGETRIPSGFYEIGLMEQDTRLTLKYRKKYPWFKYHIEIKNVKGFTGVYIHIGNDDGDTAGCVLLGDKADNNRITYGTVSNSTEAFKRFYKIVYPHLEKGKKAFLEIRNEDYLIKVA